MAILYTLYSIPCLSVIVKNRVTTYDDYLLKLKGHINLVPFKTIISYINVIFYSSNLKDINHAIINNLGNIIVFIPLGYFLNQLFSFQNTKKILMVSLVIIISIELIQLFSLTGSFDVDDIILNTLGIFLGYLLTK